MAKIAFIEKRLTSAKLEMIDQINVIVESYQARGMVMTARQLYYQLVTKNIIANKDTEYDRITDIINDGKLLGLIDWAMFDDRTRRFQVQNRWKDGAEILRDSARWYHQDMWANQAYRLFVIVEKDALMGVIEDTCRQYDVPVMAARGFPSSTVLFNFARQHIAQCLRYGQDCKIIHLGDHDPSGIDMTRDLTDRLAMFSRSRDAFQLDRVALNMDQIEELRPPENPAKMTDSRFKEYRKLYGDSSWELDALSPEFLTGLLVDQFNDHIDPDMWEITKNEIAEVSAKIDDLAENFQFKLDYPEGEEDE